MSFRTDEYLMRDGGRLEYYFHKVPKWEVESVGITKRPN